MKPISEYLSNMQDRLKNKQDKPHEDPSAIGTQTAQIVNGLFTQLKAICPAYKQSWPTQEIYETAKRLWIETFIAQGISSIERLKFGLNKLALEEKPFIPSVGQFIAMCTPTPEDLGLPTLDAAYREACRNSHPCETSKKWSHQAVYHAWTMTDNWALRTQPTTESLPLFKYAYEQTADMLLRGEKLKPIPKALPENIHEPATRTPEKARDAIAAMKAILQ